MGFSLYIICILSFKNNLTNFGSEPGESGFKSGFPVSKGRYNRPSIIDVDDVASCCIGPHLRSEEVIGETEGDVDSEY